MKPLSDVTVIDATMALAGPYATMLLAGLGAKVIKVEDPQSGDASRNNSPYIGREGISLGRKHEDDLSLAALSRLRNKFGVTVNLKSADGRAVFLDLCRNADVLVQNFSRGVMDRLGVGYEDVRAVNPRLVYCSISGFGTVGEPGGGKAMDSLIQGLSGAMLTSGLPEDPPIRVGFPVADLAAPIYGVIGILSALHHARNTGVGQHVDVSMLGALSAMVAVEPWNAMEACGVPTRTGAGMPRLAPFGNYKTTDGYVVICAPLENFALGLYKAMGRPELADDPRFNTRDARVRNAKQLDVLIEQWTVNMTAAEVVETLNAAGAPAAQIRTPMEAVQDPLVVARGETNKLTHPRYEEAGEVFGTGLPIVFSETVAGFDKPPPELGQHNDEILGELLQYSPEMISQLRAKGAI